MESQTTRSATHDGVVGTHDHYDSVLEALLSHEHVFFSAPTSPHRLLIPQQQVASSVDQLPTIASLSVHPVIESLLHLLNCDLPSAHFLCRHAEVEPKWESMYVHGILHRIEGDIDNTRAWYGNVKETEIFQKVWVEARESDTHVPPIASKGWEHFLDRVERYRDRTMSRSRSRSRNGKGGRQYGGDGLIATGVEDWKDEEHLLRESSLWEIKQALRASEGTFGVREIADASGEFAGRIASGNQKLIQIAQSMVTGGEGWRSF